MSSLGLQRSQSYLEESSQESHPQYDITRRNAYVC